MALSLDEALGMSLTDETDESIHVDIDTRQVTIPESQQVFGVESDEDVEVKHIVIDGRYNDGIDLSTFTFRINYQNANGDKGTYLATELKVNDDSIEFDWVIGRQVVAYKGTIAFIVCAYTIDSSSVIQNEWNSTLGKGTVLEGLEVSEFDFGDDIVRQLASILSDVNAAQASAKASADEAYKSKTEVVALGKEQQAAIEKKGKDTLATIPDDYTQVSNDVSQLKEATAKLKDGKISKFYASSQGNTNLPDSDDGRIMDLKLYGKSEQKQYSGKNLLKVQDAKFIPGYTTTINGIKFTIVENGGVSASGTATATTFFCPYIAQLKAGVTCRAVSNQAVQWSMRDRTGNTTYFTYVNTAYVPQSNLEAVIFFRIAAGNTINATEYAMVTTDLNATPTDYEPYVGGIPSPNPDYPQEIKSVVNPTVKVCGKNLVGKLLPGVIAFDSGNYRNTEVGYACTGFIPVKPGEIYTISNGTGGAERWYYSSDKKPVNHMPAGANITVTIPDGIAYMRVSCYVDNKYKFQIEKGSTATAYEPYTEQTATLPYTLNAIPVTSGGNVTVDGQQYIADYVDVERGKLVRMCKEIDFEKVDPIGEQNLLTNSREIRYSTNSIGIKALPASTPSNEAGFITSIRRLAQGLGTWNVDQVGVWQCGQGENNNILVIRAPLATVLDVVEYFKSIGGCKGVFQAATPTETDLTADEIAAFKALVSYYPVTNVSTTSDQLDGYTVFNYPISLANGWDYVKQQLGDTRDYLYGIDLMTAEAYVNSEYAAALAEIEV